MTPRAGAWEPTPADAVTLATLLTLTAAQVAPGPGALRAIQDQIDSRTGAPGWTPGTPPRQAVYLRGHTAMTSMQVQAHQLRPDDVITRHPDHPDQVTHYRVGTVRHVSHAEMMVDYTYTSTTQRGVLTGVLVLAVDQLCRIEPAHASGGVR